MQRISAAMTALLVCGFAQTCAAADTLEAVEKKLAAKWAKTKSVSAKASLESSKTTTTGTSRHVGQGTFEYLGEGGKTMFRIDVNFTSTRLSPAGKELNKIESASLTVCDGRFLFDLTKGTSKTTAEKHKADATRALHGRSVFENLRKHNKLKLLPDDKVDDQSVYVIEATPTAQYSFRKKTLACFSKETGFPLRVTTYDWADRVTSKTTYTDVKINPKIPPERFVFTAPEGIDVVDKSKE